MTFWLLAGAVALLAFATLLPLWRHPAWWVRGLDFPRVQLALFAVALAVAEGLLIDVARPAGLVLLGVTLACLAYHFVWILPYTPLAPREVQNARDPHAPRLRLLTANVLTPNRRAPDFLRLVHAHDPDVVITVETDRWWEEQLGPQLSAYPHRLRCPQDNLYGMHVFSRLPLEDAKIQFLVEKDVPSMHTLLVLPSGQKVRLHCLHPAPPTPTENETSAERDAELIMVGRAAAEARLPVIVTGDLNDVAWSATTRLFRKISGLLDPRVGRGFYNTFHTRYPWFRWPVDHVFHSRHFSIVRLERLPPFGSDHFAMLFELALDGEAAAAQSGEGLEADAEDEEVADETTAAQQVDDAAVHRPGEKRRGPPN